MGGQATFIKAAAPALSVLLIGGAATAQPASTIAGDWRLVRQSDPLDDTGSVYAVIGTQAEHLAVGCELGRPAQVILRTRNYLGENRRGLLAGGRAVSYRFDREQPVTEQWSYAAQAASAGERRQVADFMHRLRGSTSLYLRVTKHDGEHVNYRMDYGAPDDIVDQIQAACFRATGTGPENGP